MGYLIFGILFLLVAIVAPFATRSVFGGLPRAASGVASGFFVAMSMLMFAMTSFIVVPDGNVAHLTRLYMADSLPQGRIISASGNEMGKQARIIRQGFHFSPFIDLLYDVENKPTVVVPADQLAILMAKDGTPMPDGQTFAKKVPLDVIMDAERFLTDGGEKGQQITILPPGTWPINLYLFDYELIDITVVNQGMVGVIKSNAKSSINLGNITVSNPTDCSPVTSSQLGDNALSNRLVPAGCIGIWNEALAPGKYYLNTNVYWPIYVDTRQQAWEYRGGYTSRSVALTVDSKGDILQTPTSSEITQPKNAKDAAIAIKVDGYTIYQNARALIQIIPSMAPFVVASVGGMEQVEDRVITPAIQSSLRDLAGQFITIIETVMAEDTGLPILNEDGSALTRQVRRPIVPMDFVEHRDLLQKRIGTDLVVEALKAGVTLREVRFLNADLPPEVLIPRKRKQLAYQMRETLIEEEKTQAQRVRREKTAAEADKQVELAGAEIAVKRAEQVKLERQKLGEAERLYLTELAAGEKARTEVLGADRVMTIKLVELVLGAFDKNPELANIISKLVPDVVVGENSGMSGAFAVLAKGLSNGMTPPIAIPPTD